MLIFFLNKIYRCSIPVLLKFMLSRLILFVFIFYQTLDYKSSKIKK